MLNHDRSKISLLMRIVGLTLALAVFIFLVTRAIRGVMLIINSGYEFSPTYLFLSFACQLVGVLIAATIWSNILKHLSIRAGFKFDLEAFCITAIARKLPGPGLYAFGRLILYDLINKPKSLVIVALIIEAIALSLGGLITLFISFQYILIPNDRFYKEILTFIVVPTLIITFSLLGPKIIGITIEKTKRFEKSKIPNPKPVSAWDTLRWQFGQVIVVMLAAGVAFFLLKSIDARSSVPFFSILAGLSVAVIIGPIITWLPGDFGLKDGIMYLAFSYWMDNDMAAAVTIAWRIWVYALEITFGLISGIAINQRLNYISWGRKIIFGDSDHD